MQTNIRIRQPATDFSKQWNQTIYVGSDFGKVSVPVPVPDPNLHPDRIQAIFIEFSNKKHCTNLAFIMLEAPLVPIKLSLNLFYFFTLSFQLMSDPE